jgi:drug/metabolite transporter (DMT)-like permease
MRWNSFTIIGIILIAVGIFGLAKGPNFQFDPGLPSPPLTWLWYALVGILMIVNGHIAPQTVAAAKTVKIDADADTEPKS